jgi:hypothetical protein
MQFWEVYWMFDSLELDLKQKLWKKDLNSLKNLVECTVRSPISVFEFFIEILSVCLGESNSKVNPENSVHYWLFGISFGSKSLGK